MVVLYIASVAWRSSQLVKKRETSAAAPRVALLLAARRRSFLAPWWLEREATLAMLYNAVETESKNMLQERKNYTEIWAVAFMRISDGKLYLVNDLF